MERATVIYRHTVVTRILHWLNALCVFLVLMSGLQIFNAHPRLYWGEYGANTDAAFIQLGGGHAPGEKAFPPWATIPGWQDLAGGRRWHFFFAWVLVFNSALYLLVSLVNGHVRRDLVPSRAEISARHLARELWNHLRLQFPVGTAARHYNTLQKLAYLAVIFVLAPMMLLTGLTLSPGIDAAAPWLLDLLGGRQSARTLHFLTAMLIVLFIAVHLVMVVLAGPLNELRSMVTGRFELPPDKTE
ncbi:MAG: cytochrome b/b6 domain-containing protein [Steroidobacteraceae bacterium]